MCSLFGWLDYQGIIPHKVLRKLTQALANAAEERGTDAAGISYINEGKVVIYKRPKPAHKLHFNPPDGTRAIMGHTRMTTQGNEKFNYNNHPFAGFAGDTSFAFAHNGVLWNDKELRKDKLIPDTHIETEQNIIIDKASGKDTEREGYQYLKRQILRRGDTLVIKELDRLSRNKADIKRELEEFKGMGIRVKILDIPTTLTDFPPEQAWVLEMINAILIEVLGAIAENERNKIRARQREGIEAAKKKNVRFGRPPKSLPDNWQQIMADVRNGNKRPVEAIRELGISRSYFYMLYNRLPYNIIMSGLTVNNTIMRAKPVLLLTVALKLNMKE